MMRDPEQTIRQPHRPPEHFVRRSVDEDGYPEIKAMLAEGKTQREVAEYYGFGISRW